MLITDKFKYYLLPNPSLAMHYSGLCKGINIQAIVMTTLTGLLNIVKFIYVEPPIKQK